MVASPEEVAPVEPEVPLLLLVPAEPPVDGEVAVEPPDAPIPDLVPDVDELGVDALVDPDGVDTEPEAEPPVEPIPEAVPDALPVAVVPQAASAALQITGRRILIISTPVLAEVFPRECRM